MKLLFVENRYVTWLWCEVALRLRADGHDIHWLVQNPVFAPRWGRVHQLPFPKRGQAPASASLDADSWLRHSDRGVLHFGVGADHHAHYRAAIALALDEIQPEMIFGEPTQFHELITIAQARERGIPYLFPSSTRYPPGRMAFHLYDTLETVGGCGDELSLEASLHMREAILQRKVIPSYMAAAVAGKATLKFRAMVDMLRVTRGWLAGERFITPSPWRKFQLGRQLRATVARWEKGAFAALPAELSSKRWVLYAMQMQPESNIDVWGYPWNDQVAIIRAAADALTQVGSKLVVKPNPKSKHEMSEALCQLAASHPGIVPLSHACKMVDVFPHASAVLSVTGTVLLEAVLACKPVGVLGAHAMSRYPGVTALPNPAAIAGLVREVEQGTAHAATSAQAARLLSDIHLASYGGTLYDPLNQPELATGENLDRIVNAFRDVLKVDGTLPARRRWT